MPGTNDEVNQCMMNSSVIFDDNKGKQDIDVSDTHQCIIDAFGVTKTVSESPMCEDIRVMHCKYSIYEEYYENFTMMLF